MDISGSTLTLTLLSLESLGVNPNARRRYAVLSRKQEAVDPSSFCRRGSWLLSR